MVNYEYSLAKSHILLSTILNAQHLLCEKISRGNNESKLKAKEV